MRSVKRTNSADVANLFVRYLLCEISEEMDGFKEEDKNRTLRYFNRRCAYTGKRLSEKNLTFDHLVPHNRSDCGLHLYGNIVPATNDANKAKGAKNFEEFLRSDHDLLSEMSEKDREDRIEKIKKFQNDSGYLDIVELFENLDGYLNNRYKKIQNSTAEAFREIEDKFLTDEFRANFKRLKEKKKIDDEICKVENKIPIWLSRPDQICSRIFIVAMNILEEDGYINYETLKVGCSDIPTFDNNLSQMYNMGKNNHAKVFDFDGDRLKIWGPVKEYLKEEYNKSIYVIV